tara:strand:+ start:4845 stop:5087 length:243 start_codon:yes stop_codon:yes gene_type:complete
MKAVRREVSRSVIEHFINNLVERLASQSRYGKAPDGVSVEMMAIYQEVRHSLFGGTEEDNKGSTFAWRVLVKMGLYLTDH